MKRHFIPFNSPQDGELSFGLCPLWTFPTRGCCIREILSIEKQLVIRQKPRKIEGEIGATGFYLVCLKNDLPFDSSKDWFNFNGAAIGFDIKENDVFEKSDIRFVFQFLE